MRYLTLVPSILCLQLVAARLGAGELHYAPSGSDFERRLLDASCAAPGSPVCNEALADAVPKAAASLVRLAERRHPKAAELARRAADSAQPELRIAAATALGQLSVEASFTPVLGELLDDPVPAVRAEALRALYGAMDERGRALAQRADRFGTWTRAASLEVESAPATSGLGVALPSDALFLHLGSDVATGRYAFVTGESPSALAARLNKTASGPFAPDQWYEMLLSLEETGDDEEAAESDDDSDSEMPSAADFAKAMEMMAKMNQAMAENPDAKTPEQQARVMAKALDGRRSVDSNLGNLYGVEELFGDPQLFLVELSDGSDVAVAVYYDKVLQRTGIAVHRQP